MIEAMRNAAGKGLFALQRCEMCDAVQYPPREICGACLSDRLNWDLAPAVAGELLARTSLHRSNESRFCATLPLDVGLVRLVPGPVALCFLHGNCRPGTPVLVRSSLDAMLRPVLTATRA
jgi:uncharacterized OB-fold protein